MSKISALIALLDGKKTYLAALGLVLVALGSFLSGEQNLLEAVNQALLGLGIAALRLGVSKK